MALFAGTFENKVDGKGRVSVPAQFRTELEGGHAGAIYLYPSLECDAIEACTVEWMEEMKAGIARLPKFSKERRALSMSVFGRARLTRLEETGRLVLPKDMADRAGIAEKAAFIGMGDSFLIWNPGAAEAELYGATAIVINEGLTIDPSFDPPFNSGGGRKG